MTILIDSTDPWQHTLSITASATLGVAVFLLVARVLMIVDRHIHTFAEEWEFEQTRRVRLRKAHSIYRWTEPLIDELASANFARSFGLDKIELSLQRGGSELPWSAREYVAASIMESVVLLLTLLFAGMVTAMTSTFAIGGALLTGIYLRTSIRTLHRTADERVDQIQRRLPFGIDLMALMMKVGAGFREALETVVLEAGKHPFSEEFGRVLADVNRGRTLSDALGDLDERLRCEDLKEVIFAIRKSEELGTPLSEIFSTVADQMRQKKSAWAEAAAGKAQVKVQFPGFIIMLACLLTILSPFLFGLVTSSASLF